MPIFQLLAPFDPFCWLVKMILSFQGRDLNCSMCSTSSFHERLESSFLTEETSLLASFPVTVSPSDFYSPQDLLGDNDA